MGGDANKPKGNIHAKVRDSCPLVDKKFHKQMYAGIRWKAKGSTLAPWTTILFKFFLIFLLEKNLQLFLHLEHEDGHNSNIKIFQELLALAVPP